MISIKSFRRRSDIPEADVPSGLFVPDRADSLAWHSRSEGTDETDQGASDHRDVLDIAATPAREEPAPRRSIFGPRAKTAPLTPDDLRGATSAGHATEMLAGEVLPSKRKGWFRRDKAPVAANATAAAPVTGGEDADWREAPGASTVAGKKRKRFFGKKTAAPGAALAEPLNVPIQIIMGFLPEVTSRDAIEYAIGMSEKYVVQQSLAYFHATKYENGYLYEVHEGGPGKAFGPEIAKLFASKGAYRGDEVTRVTLATSARMVEITRLRLGLSAVLLPESSVQAATEGLVPRVMMTSAIPRRTAILYAGVGLLVSGVLMATLSGVFFRLKGYSAPPAQANDVISVRNLPHIQWERLSAQLQPGDRVKALKYENNNWRTELFPSASATGATGPVPTLPSPSEQVPAPPSPNGAPQ